MNRTEPLCPSLTAYPRNYLAKLIEPCSSDSTLGGLAYVFVLLIVTPPILARAGTAAVPVGISAATIGGISTSVTPLVAAAAGAAAHTVAQVRATVGASFQNGSYPSQQTQASIASSIATAQVSSNAGLKAEADIASALQQKGLTVTQFNQNFSSFGSIANGDIDVGTTYVNVQVNIQSYRNANLFLDRFGAEFVKNRANPYAALGVVSGSGTSKGSEYVVRQVVVYAPNVYIDWSNTTIQARMTDLARHGIVILGQGFTNEMTAEVVGNMS